MKHTAIISFCAVILALAASRSFACLNDRSMSAAEQEFRSRYDPAAGTDSPAQRISRLNGINPWAIAALAIGGGLFAGSMIVTRRQRSGAI
jgi:hypothetical protein